MHLHPSCAQCVKPVLLFSHLVFSGCRPCAGSAVHTDAQVSLHVTEGGPGHISDTCPLATTGSVGLGLPFPAACTAPVPGADVELW